MSKFKIIKWAIRILMICSPGILWTIYPDLFVKYAFYSFGLMFLGLFGISILWKIFIFAFESVDSSYRR